jgi:Tfp pilus assembly protein PilN
MTQVNLLPPEIKQRERTRQLTGLVILGGVALVALLVALFVLESAKVSSADKDLRAQQQKNAALQAQISQLAPFGKLQTDVAAARSVFNAQLGGQVLWSGVLQNVSNIIPDQMYLTGIIATAGQSQGAVGTPPTNGIIGTIQFQGVSSDRPTVALWLTRLEQVKGWVNAWVSNVIEATGTSGAPSYTFSASVDLTSDATTPVTAP